MARLTKDEAAYQFAKKFGSVTEYQIFKENYCGNDCVHHKEDERGYPALTLDGGCPIEDRVELGRYEGEFPNVLLEVWDEESCLCWHHCPFYRKIELDWSE